MIASSAPIRAPERLQRTMTRAPGSTYRRAPVRRLPAERSNPRSEQSLIVLRIRMQEHQQMAAAMGGGRPQQAAARCGGAPLIHCQVIDCVVNHGLARRLLCKAGASSAADRAAQG